MKNNVLVVAANSKFSHSSLALRYFRENSGCEIYECSINDNIFDVYAALNELKYSIICFSVYIWNVEFTLKLVPMLKNAKPDVRIIFGGPEAGYNYKDLMEKYEFIDGIIYGEGECAISALSSGKANEDIPNFIYRKGTRIVLNDAIKTDLQKIKFPYNKEDLTVLQNKIIYFETSRGCCFNCSYCLSSSEGNTRYFDIEYVKNGIKFFIDNNVPLIKFVDRTFNENNKRACEILKFINDYNAKTMFHFEISPQLITEEFAGLLAESRGFVQLEIGVQTTNKETMKCIKRYFDIEDIRKKINLIPNGIHTHMDLIAGLPKENLESFIGGFNFVYSLKPDMLQLGFLKLLHNTKLKEEAKEFGIITTSFPPYEVISTNDMSADDIILLKKVEKAVDKIYNSGAFKETLKTLKHHSPFEIFKQIGFEIYQREKSGPVSKNGLYEIMYATFGDKIKQPLVLDFLKNNPKANLPVCLADNRGDLKDIYKELVKSDIYKDVKIRVAAACGKIFVVNSGKIDII